MCFCEFLHDCGILFSSLMRSLCWWCNGEIAKAKQTWREGDSERWYRWERKSTSSHTETINKLSSQSISYGLAWIIALCQSCLCVAWEWAQGDVIAKCEASTAMGLTLIVTFVIERAEESLGGCCGAIGTVLGEFRYRQMSKEVQLSTQWLSLIQNHFVIFMLFIWVHTMRSDKKSFWGCNEMIHPMPGDANDPSSAEILNTKMFNIWKKLILLNESHKRCYNRLVPLSSAKVLASSSSLFYLIAP